MGYAPSLTYLAKDVIGQGIAQAADRDHDKLDIAIRVGIYNFVLSELFTVIGFVDTEAWLTESDLKISSAGDTAKHGKLTLTTELVDKISAIKFKESIAGGTIQYESYDISLRDFLSHLRNGSAMSPYDEGIIYAQQNKIIQFLVGENLTDINYDGVSAIIYYRRIPTPLTISLYETAKLDAPDRFYALIVSRIASLVESQKGITDKSLVLVKTAYEQLLASVDPTVKAGILKSLSLPAGEAYDLQGYISKGS
jgi:hypothetical protein